ncbi:MAG: C25 family cysteine peptidase, partial [Bacteroidetes bacterium]|nr:C25 family cysteine peptidase [Bacteroidota bacterium]
MIYRRFVPLLFSLIFRATCLDLRAGMVEKTFYFKDYSINKKGDYQVFALPGGLVTGKVGSPALPWFSLKMLLPPGEAAYRIEFTGDDLVTIPGSYHLFPSQSSYPISSIGNHVFAFNERDYASRSVFPEQACNQVVTQYMNGYAIGLSTFTPVQYIPADGRISYYRKVTIRIYTQPDEKSLQLVNTFSCPPSAQHRVSVMADNPEIVKLYPTSPVDTSDYQILIISPEAFLTSFQPLIDLYRNRGWKARVKSLASITGTMTGVDDQEKMRNYIIQEYQTKRIEQVLLAGDADLIPYRGLYCDALSGGQHLIDAGIPSDIYYSALNGTWNADNDSYWGEPGEADLLPEISVGRIPAGNTTELNNLLAKTISYLNSPVTADLDKPLLVGEWLYDNPPSNGSTYLKMLIGNHNENSYTTVGIPVTDPYDTLYDRHSPTVYSWTKAELLAKINTGHSFLHHLGHSNWNILMRMGTGDIIPSNFASVDGITHNYMCVYTEGCICGAFDYNDCMGELMVNISNFAVNFIGNSRYGWFNEGHDDGPSLHLQREFVNAMYKHQEGSVGMAHTMSKIATAPFVFVPNEWEPGATRWVM